jgi:hypothetical protein
MYCRERLRRPSRGRPVLVWSPLEHPIGNDRYAELLGAPRLEGSIPRLCDALTGGARAVVYVPAPAQLAEQFALFCKIARRLRGARVLVEELSHVTTASWAPPDWKALSTAGAHQGLELIGTAQRPTMIDKAFLGNCTEIRCYRLFYEEDARALGRALQRPWQEVMNLPDLHYIHRVIRERKTAAGVQKVS